MFLQKLHLDMLIFKLNYEKLFRKIWTGAYIRTYSSEPRQAEKHLPRRGSAADQSSNIGQIGCLNSDVCMF